jgi:protocatechuate 3,4-dioxygenase beta subunit
VQVDVWQCDAGGVYSDDANTGEPGGRFLRGYQIADANGVVQFTTIYPGWYPGRTVHIHYRVRAAGGVDFASQVYFDDAITDEVLTTSAYVALPGLPACGDASSCRAALAAALPDPDAAQREARQTARQLARLFARVTSALDRAEQASGAKQRRLRRKARSGLARIAGVAAAAERAGSLGVPAVPLVQAADALRASV